MRLQRLHLKNFKGLRDFIFEPEGHNASIFGDNATGKTTLIDGFSWCLFGKDSLGQAQFEIKTMNGGEPEHGLDHEVEVILDDVTLRKVLTEKWTKKRGSADRTFTGHDINHFVDGVPVKKGEFDARIGQICDEQTFRLLTNPRYFSEGLHWQKRREVLLQVCGDVSDLDVINSNPKLQVLPGILGKRSIDDHRKIILARRVEVNREIEQIPVRISEVQAGMIPPEQADEKRINSKIAVLISELKAKQQEFVRLESGGEIAELTAELRRHEAKRLDLQNKVEKERQTAVQFKHAEIEALRSRIIALAPSEQHAKINDNLRNIQRLEVELDALRTNWQRVFDEQFSARDLCPICGQTLPAEYQAEVLGRFNQDKAGKLAFIRDSGHAARERVDSLKAANEKLGAEINTADAGIEQLKTELEQRQQEAIDLNALVAEPSQEIKALEQLILAIRSRISELQAGSKDTIDEVKVSIATIEEELHAERSLQANLEHMKTAEARIAELKKNERIYAKEYENIEHELFLCDLFLRTKVSMLTTKINSKFRFTRFKLFNELISGGIEPCCEVSVNGVTHSNLNNAMRIQSGLDIIQALQEHYGVRPPVWVDNSEAITSFPPMNCQMIHLYVSAKDKTLRIEKENNA